MTDIKIRIVQEAEPKEIIIIGELSGRSKGDGGTDESFTFHLNNASLCNISSVPLSSKKISPSGALAVTLFDERREFKYWVIELSDNNKICKVTRVTNMLEMKKAGY